MKYTYFCQKCKSTFVIEAKIGTVRKVTCPNGCSSRVVRKYFPVNVQFRGEGFYKTENKK